jgi:hypothetical protein
MLYRSLADAAIAIHVLFILFVVFGGLTVFRWPRMAWVHVPTFLWGGGIAILGWICPLTYLENYLRMKGAGEGYETSFVEHYLLPMIYPELIFPGGFPRWGFVALGIAVLAVNGAIYWCVWKRPRRRDRGPPAGG